MHNLTIPLDPETIQRAIATLSELTFPIRLTVNNELQELVVLCDVRHAADVERTLAPFV